MFILDQSDPTQGDILTNQIPTRKMKRMGIARLTGLRNLAVTIRRYVLTRIMGMDIHPTVQLSMSCKLDRNYPVGVHIGAHSYLAFESRVLCHDFTRGLYVDTWIGKNCFIGGRSMIMPGVRIGDGSIVGAGSIVTKDVPPRCAVAGNPAQIIKENINTVAYGRLAAADQRESELVTEMLNKQGRNG